MRAAVRKESRLALRLVVWLSLLLSAPSITAEQLPIKKYTADEGLPHDRVKHLVQDTRGFIWISTSGGLCRFDGARFTVFSVADGLPNPSANFLLETRRGGYWVATNGGGVARFNLPYDSSASTVTLVSPQASGSGFTVYPVGEEVQTQRVNVLLEDQSGSIWAGTDGGLFRLDREGGQFQRVPVNIPAQAELRVQIRDMLEDREGNLWIATQFGLVRRLADGRTSYYACHPEGGVNGVYALREDGVGRLWVGGQVGLIVFHPLPAATGNPDKSSPWRTLNSRDGAASLPAAPGEARWFTVADGLADNALEKIHLATDGRAWLGTRGGLSMFDGQSFRSYTTRHGLRANLISTLAEDRTGNLWIGTLTAGVMKLPANSFVNYQETEGLGSNEILALGETPAGEFYVITSHYLVHRFDSQRLVAVHLNLPTRLMAQGSRRRIIVDHLGEWWVPTSEGLYRFPRVARIEQLARAHPKMVYTIRHGLAEDDLYRLFEDSRGDLWLASFTPGNIVLTRWERATGKFHHYGEANGLPPFNAPTCFAEDKSGQVWIGFREGGLARYAAGHFTFLTGADGLPPHAMNSLYVDHTGKLWIGVIPGGIGYLDNLSAARPRCIFPAAEAVLGHGARTIAGDRWGHIYFGSDEGLSRLDLATGHIRHYTTADGLVNNILNVAYQDREGRLWLGSDNGLSRFAPGPDHPLAPPLALISGLRIAGAPYAISALGANSIAVADLASNQNQLNVDFLGLGAGPGEALRFQYKLEGADRDWGQPTEQHTVNYSRLAPGAYRFLVRAVSADGTLSPTPASIAFNILPPVWRRQWFITLVVVLIASALMAFDRYRVARLKELEAALTESQQLTGELTAQRAELRQAHHALELDSAITNILAEATTPGEAAPRMLRAICESTGWQIGAIWNIDPQTHTLHCANVWHPPGTAALKFEALTRQRVFLPGEGLPGRVLQSGETHWITDITVDDNFPRTDAATEEGLRSAFGFPVLLRGEVIGVLEFFSRQRRERDDEQIRMMSAIGSHMGQLIERRRGEEALRESETRFRTFAETASDAIITVNASGTIVFANPAAEKVFGHPATEMIGKDLTMLMPDYLRHLHQAGFARYQQTGRRHISWQAIELPGLHRGGQEVPLEISFGEFTSDGRRYFTGIARDITERKRAEEALRRSREERLVELERVRRRIATDLHDDIGSSLTQISILSEVVQQRINHQDSRVTEQLSMIAGASRELVDAMSDIVWAINPQKDHLHDLTQRMRRFAADSFTARNIKFQLRLPPAEEDVKLGANLRREVFLIFKEGVNNMVRHSGCTQADIELSFVDGRLRLRLSDNGRGFDATRENDGHGLVSMRDRAKSIGGQFELHSQVGYGTVIELAVPFDQQQSIE
jgi:PAS domain S-box-containing protein